MTGWGYTTGKSEYQAAASVLGKRFWRTFLAYPLSRSAFFALLVICLLAVFADFLAPYRNFYTNRGLNFSPPTRIHIIDETGRLTRPFIYHHERGYDAHGRPIYRVDTSITYELRFFVRSDNPRDAYTPFPLNLLPLPLRQRLGVRARSNLKLVAIDAPMDEVPFYPLGSDIVGNDVFSSILYGTRWSLAVGVAGSLLAAVIGLLMALAARAFGGLVDLGLMGMTAVLTVLPSIFLLLAVLTLFYQLGLPTWLAIGFILIDAALLDLGTLARAFRERVRIFNAGRPAGIMYIFDLQPPHNLFDHLLQHGLGYFVVGWGMVLAVRRSFLDASYLERWWVLLPAPFLVLAVWAWTIVGDSLRHALEETEAQLDRS